MTSETKPAGPPNPKTRWLARGGVFASLLSLIGASCCVLPIVLVNIGVSTALVSRLAVLARYQSWFQWGAVALLVAATIITFRRGRPQPRTLVWLGIGIVLVTAAHMLPLYEGEMLRWLNPR
ncbi:hypothetical protein [Hyphomonas johnsonii]|uniref:Mercury ion transport protein n=1 Tax=Hyphomonas johnsonii MHS-2 TaxID=1280950 RepID=A0A059FNB8_9PROT|nr:hypothetical protein [Hyphomonas johnsonii]KCZ92175.1 hypothetical protein HJO_09074 [Hyphomonas johnsonii MHS-2]